MTALVCLTQDFNINVEPGIMAQYKMLVTANDKWMQSERSQVITKYGMKTRIVSERQISDQDILNPHDNDYLLDHTEYKGLFISMLYSGACGSTSFVGTTLLEVLRDCINRTYIDRSLNRKNVDRVVQMFMDECRVFWNSSERFPEKGSGDWNIVMTIGGKILFIDSCGISEYQYAAGFTKELSGMVAGSWGDILLTSVYATLASEFAVYRKLKVSTLTPNVKRHIKTLNHIHLPKVDPIKISPRSPYSKALGSTELSKLFKDVSDIFKESIITSMKVVSSMSNITPHHACDITVVFLDNRGIPVFLSCDWDS